MAEKRTYADRREYMREYITEYRRRRKAADPEWAQLVQAQNHARRTPEMHRAHEAVRRAVKSGRLVRPSACEACGASGFVEAAHADYDRRFDVRWLCRPCHRTWDRAEPKACKP